MYNKIIKKISLVLCCLLTVISFFGCGSKFEVSLSIGDGKKENDSVSCHYTIADSFSDDYVIKGWFDAESEADLNDKFVFSISFDERFSALFHETVLYELDGEQLKTAKNGKLQFEINLGQLSKIFEKTAEQKEFTFHFHRENASPTDIMAWGDSSYNYTYDGKKVKLDK